VTPRRCGWRAATRAAGLSAALVAVSCASGTQEARGPSSATPAASAAAPTGPQPLLPAGLCFRAGYLHQVPGCGPAQAAVVIGVYPTVAAAAKALAAFPAGRLPLGYPFVERAEVIGLAGIDEGVALVAGFLRDSDAARTWQEAHRELLGDATIVELVGDEERDASLRKKYGDDHARQHVIVRIQAGGALAYDPRSIEATLGHVHDRDDLGVVPPGQLQPACQLPGDALFDTTVGGLSFFYRWAPVECAGRPAYVRWTQTLLDAAVLAHPDGSYRVVQVVEVSCDVPTLARWSYDQHGRTSTPETLPTTAGCGEDDDGEGDDEGEGDDGSR
jgi:hypothetical protein